MSTSTPGTILELTCRLLIHVSRRIQLLRLAHAAKASQGAAICRHGERHYREHFCFGRALIATASQPQQQQRR